MATSDPASGTSAQTGPSKAERRAARAAVGAYHEAELARLIEHVREGLARLDAGEIDAFELDELIHHYKRAAQKLWSSACAAVRRRGRSSGCGRRANSPTGGIWHSRAGRGNERALSGAWPYRGSRSASAGAGTARGGARGTRRTRLLPPRLPPPSAPAAGSGRQSDTRA